MEQLIAHLVGDYVLQNHWMATKKTTSSLAAFVHVMLYGLPFLLLVSNPLQWLVIVGTHFAIDRWRLAKYWIEFWGIGCPGWLSRTFGNDEESATAPPFLGVWLLIIVDNTAHLTINYLALSQL